MSAQLLLIDVGNTHTHLGVADERRIVRPVQIPTDHWGTGQAQRLVRGLAKPGRLKGAAMCSVVPRCTPLVRQAIRDLWNIECLELNTRTLAGIGIDYPKPKTIGPDRLANAVAAKQRFGAPVVVVDFGTAVTFDIVNAAGNFVGGVIAPGLAASTDYLHEKTALLPRVKIREIHSAIGKSTEEAMLIGAVHGFRGLVRELIMEIKKALHATRLPVVATGGYGELMAASLPEITAVEPLLTLEGLRIVWKAHHT